MESFSFILVSWGFCSCYQVWWDSKHTSLCFSFVLSEDWYSLASRTFLYDEQPLLAYTRFFFHSLVFFFLSFSSSSCAPWIRALCYIYFYIDFNIFFHFVLSIFTPLMVSSMKIEIQFSCTTTYKSSHLWLLPFISCSEKKNFHLGLWKKTSDILVGCYGPGKGWTFSPGVCSLLIWSLSFGGQGSALVCMMLPNSWTSVSFALSPWLYWLTPFDILLIQLIKDHSHIF